MKPASGAARWVVELRSIAERGGAALGDVYALAARAVLHEKERLEDLAAEARFRQRSEARPRKTVRGRVSQNVSTHVRKATPRAS